jgi:hypothetical protein
MQNFFSTLAQVSATLLGIFLAATIAYFVFLKDHATTFSDRIEGLKVDIGSELSRLNTEWPQALGHFVPPLFRDKYRAKYPDKSEPALIYQLTIDLVFYPNDLINVVREASGDPMADGPWEGRLYAFILTEIVRMVGGGVPGILPTVFPASPSGPGFDQWRENFKQIQGSVNLLRISRSAMISNFVPHIREQPYEDQTKRMVNQAAEKFFTTIAKTQTNLEDLDKSSLAQQRYLLLGPTTRFSLLVTSILWFVLGIALPLVLLAFPQTAVNSLAAIAILLGTFLFAVVSVVQFAIYVQAKPFDWRNFVEQRWYSPIFEELTRQETKLRDAGLVSTRYIYDALSSEERSRFDVTVITEFEKYLKAATRYNEQVLRFNAAVVAVIHADPVLGPLAADKSMRGGPVLHPYEFVAEEQRFRQLLADWEKSMPGSESDISVETEGPDWSHVELKLPGAKLYEDPARARSAFERARASILPIEPAKELIEAKKTMEQSSINLRRAMEPNLHH